MTRHASALGADQATRSDPQEQSSPPEQLHPAPLSPHVQPEGVGSGSGFAATTGTAVICATVFSSPPQQPQVQVPVETGI
ncbi:MAG: hypothetical protein ACREN2_03805 [Candidatus Dormibacteria bacterium]